MRVSLNSTLMFSVFLVAGCGTASHSTVTDVMTGHALRGAVHGGQQPVVGAHIYLLAASTAGYGSASISLLTSGVAGTDSIGGYVLTDAAGGFNISGDYTCTPAQQVYIYAAGGNPGGGANSAATFLAAVGACPAAGNFLATVPYIYVSELTTVAFAYAVSGFAVDPLHVAASNSPRAQTGLANAFAASVNLLNGVTTPAGNGTVPLGELNTLADILAACINSNGAITGPSTPTTCYTLFNNTPDGATLPADTATAVLNIAHHPAANVTALYNLKSPAVPYAPVLPAAPNDWTVAVRYTGGGLATSTALINATLQAVNDIAVDSAGNIWRPNYDANSFTELSPLGAPLSGAGGFIGGGLNHPANVAIDLADNAWTANYAGNTVSRFSAGGVPATGSPFGAGAISSPANLAVDANGAVWVANSTTLTRLDSAGANTAGSPFSSSTFNGPIGIAILPSGGVWISNALANTISVFTNSGAPAPGSPYTSGGLSYPYAIAFDSSGYGWITDQAALTRLSTSGSPGNLSYAAPNGTIPSGAGIDGSGNVWITDVGNNAILETDNSGNFLSGPIGLRQSQTAVPEAIAVDGSGNVWYSTFNEAAIYELLGAASPVVTPLAYGVRNTQLGTRP